MASCVEGDKDRTKIPKQLLLRLIILRNFREVFVSTNMFKFHVNTEETLQWLYMYQSVNVEKSCDENFGLNIFEARRTPARYRVDPLF